MSNSELENFCEVELHPRENRTYDHHHHQLHLESENPGVQMVEILPEYSTVAPPPYSVANPELGGDDDDGVPDEAVVMRSGSQMNMFGVFLHVFGDALGSVVVIASALVIKFVPYPWVYRLDPAMSIIMAAIILTTTIPLFKASAMILLQTVPTHIKVSELRNKLLTKVNEITGLHEFHVWQLAGNRIVASGHIRVNNLTDYSRIALKVKSFFHDEGIHSTTFQPEFNENEEELPKTDRDCFLECGPDKECFESTCCSNQLKKKNKNSDAGSQDGSPSSEGNDEATSDSNRQTTTHEAATVIDMEDCTTNM